MSSISEENVFEKSTVEAAGPGLRKMLRQSQRTTPESEAEEAGSSEDLFNEFNEAAGESQIVDGLEESNFFTPWGESDFEAETEIITDADEAVGADDDEEEERKQKKRSTCGGVFGSASKVKVKKVKVNSSQSSSSKTQSSSGSTPVRRSNRHQKSTVPLPDFSPNVSPKKSAVRDGPSGFDPRAMAAKPTRPARFGLASFQKSKKLQNESPKEEKLSSVFACTPVKQDDDDQYQTDEDSSQENRNTNQSEAPDARRAKASDVFRTTPEKAPLGKKDSSQENRNTNQSEAFDARRAKDSDVFRTTPEKAPPGKKAKFNPFQQFEVLKPREDVQCESDSSQDSKPSTPKKKTESAEVIDVNSSQESTAKKSALRTFRKQKSNPMELFSQIDKEAEDDEPPTLEVRPGPGKRGTPKKSPRKTPRKRKALDLAKALKVFATDDKPKDKPSTSTAFNTNNFMSKEISGLMTSTEGKGDPSKKKAATLARRRLQATFLRRNSFSQSVSPMEVDDDSSDVFDPRAMASKPTRRNSRSKPARADSSEDFVSPKPKKSRKQPEKGQKKVSDFFSKASPPSPEVSPEPESPNSRGDESELNDFTDRLSMACIDDILAVPESNLDKIEAFMKELEEKGKEREVEDAIEEEDEEEHRRKQRAKEAFEAENRALKERLEAELTEALVSDLMHNIMPHLRDLWDGKVENSSRYSAWKKGGLARRALLYHMITYPFSDAQLKWVLDEIHSYFAPTTQLQQRHSDFVWKVILAEAFIGIYRDHFGLGSKEEAERRIKNTPLPDDGNEDAW